MFFGLSPNKTFLPNLSEYDADNIKERAASKPNMKLEAREELITRNSPTKPDVPGSPELAMRKKIIMKENIGMNCAAPKLSFMRREFEYLYKIPTQKKRAAEIKPWEII